MNIFPDGKKGNLGSFPPEHHYLSVFTSYRVILSVVSVCLLDSSEKLAVFWIWFVLAQISYRCKRPVEADCENNNIINI